MLNFEEFKNTIYYTQYKIVIPLLNIRLDKFDYMKKGKIDLEKIDDKLKKLYNEKFLKNES